MSTINISREVRGGADTSLAQPTSRCRRTESIVSLERGVAHVPNCKPFLVTEAEGKHVRRRARFQQHRDASCHQFFFLLQGKASKEIHAIPSLVVVACFLPGRAKDLSAPPRDTVQSPILF